MVARPDGWLAHVLSGEPGDVCDVMAAVYEGDAADLCLVILARMWRVTINVTQARSGQTAVYKRTNSQTQRRH